MEGQSFAAGNQSLTLQTLRFKGTNLELSPVRSSFVRVKSELKEEVVVAVDEVWIDIWEAGDQPQTNAVLHSKASYDSNSKASVNLEDLTPGIYYCFFFGLDKSLDIATELYYGPKQFFRWDGAKGEFLTK